MHYKIILLTLFLLILNLLLKKVNFLLDDPKTSYHKLEKRAGTPLSGGIFLLLSIIGLYFNNLNVFFNLGIVFLLFLILMLGIFSDIKKNFSPKIRIILQLVIIFLLIFNNNEIVVLRTNINLLDSLLTYDLIKFIFSIFCIITLLNGLNFMDGVNGLVTGYLLSILITLSFILKGSNIENYIQDIIIIFSIFFIFNVLGKSFLGDNGVYVSSMIISIVIIKIINSNQNISPILAVSLLWYPALENLFTILRRLTKDQLSYLPDKLHLHSLLFANLNSNLKNIPFKYKNSLSGLIINIFLLPNFIFAYYFYDKSFYLGIFVSLYLVIYLIIYFFLSKTINN